jgi:flagellin FlaB
LGQPGTSFDTAPIEDDDGSISATNVINDQTDRAQIIFDLGDHDDSHDHDDVATVDSGDISPPLDEGEQATIQLTTEAGGETTLTLTAPETLSQKTSVTL